MGLEVLYFHFSLRLFSYSISLLQKVSPGERSPTAQMFLKTTPVFSPSSWSFYSLSPNIHHGTFAHRHCMKAIYGIVFYLSSYFLFRQSRGPDVGTQLENNDFHYICSVFQNLKTTFVLVHFLLLYIKHWRLSLL